MRLDHIVAATIDRFLARLLRRALIVAVAGLFVLIALYHANVAGVVALSMRFDTMTAHLIMGGIYLVLALIAGSVWYNMRLKPHVAPVAASPAAASLAADPRAMQLAALVEAAMLGYSMAKKNH